MPETDAVVAWLLEGDAAVRWQTLRDVLRRPRAEWEAERARVASEGWGAQLLAVQDPEGRWGGGLYNPKWVSTHYTLLLLRQMGLPRDDERARRGARLLLDGGVQPDGGVVYNARRATTSETCITGMALAVAAYFQLDDARLHGIVDHLLRVQTPDGGWNCQWVRGSKHGSFHTSISVLEGLLEYERLYPGRSDAAREARERGQEFFLAHRLYRSHTTGEVANPVFARLAFPPHWHYDILRGLDYFRDADAGHDERLLDAIGALEKRRLPDGRWRLENQHGNREWLEMDRRGGPSRWNTLRALRVLSWWQA